MDDVTFTRDSQQQWLGRGPVERMRPGARVIACKKSGNTVPVCIRAVKWENGIVALCSFTEEAQPC